mmetsp:Transcript_42163/g.134828  ORF Transcript_42163/g.134828 Transcript_42163/m.134828 type:complete len:203 (-) Transcript_42163:195-803(-)
MLRFPPLLPLVPRPLEPPLPLRGVRTNLVEEEHLPVGHRRQDGVPRGIHALALYVRRPAAETPLACIRRDDLPGKSVPPTDALPSGGVDAHVGRVLLISREPRRQHLAVAHLHNRGGVRRRLGGALPYEAAADHRPPRPARGFGERAPVYGASARARAGAHSPSRPAGNCLGADESGRAGGGRGALCGLGLPAPRLQDGRQM